MQRIVLSESESTPEKEDSPAMKEFLKKVRDKPFWIWGKTEEHERRRKQMNGNCCTTHIIGQPLKNGKPQPFWDYQYSVYKALFDNSYFNTRQQTDTERQKYDKLLVGAELMSQSKKGNIKQGNQDVLAQRSKELIHPFKSKHVWVKKFAGAGITELILRIMIWLAVKNDTYRNTHMCIVCGPRLEIAIELCNRIRKLLEPHGIMLGGSATSMKINSVTISAYPSNHLDSMRGLDKVSFIFMDEADFFLHDQENARTISERYIAKSDPFIVMVSTPNRPDGLFAQIEKEPYETCLYKKIFIHYTEAVGKILTIEEVDKMRGSPSFSREMELQYQGLIGNVFAPTAIDKVQQIEYDPDNIITDCKISIGVDPSFGSSKFGIVATRFVNERIEVIEAEDFDRDNADFNAMINRIWEIKQKHRVDKNNLTIYVDAANPEIWGSLKRMFNEPYAERYVFDKLIYYRKNNLNPAGPGGMIVIPTPFSTNGAKMLSAAKSLVEDKDNLVVIDKRFDKLLTSLRTAVAREYKLDKEQTSYHDILDAFRLSLQLYQRSNK